MKKTKALLTAVLFLTGSCLAGIAIAAYQHAGDADKDPRVFLNVYPGLAGTKLDNCATCHRGGIPPGGKSTMGSCQYCHAVTNYGQSGNYADTLNSYGKAYLDAGRNEAALRSIEGLDSDGDGYTNIAEITAVRYPGDPKDDPSKLAAPSRIFTKEQLLAMPRHKQFMIMNTTKSGDYYAEYSGVMMEDLLKRAGVSPNATQIFAYAPDGYAQRHPLVDSEDNTGKNYAPFVIGAYPQAVYFYNSQADKAVNKDPAYPGWCDYSSQGTLGRMNGDPIAVEDGLRLILALQAEGKDLVPGALGPDNKLTPESEGPYRVVAPQKVVGPPDQPSTHSNPSLIWPYDPNGDHNAGPSTKCTTIIKVEPLPPGTTDIDVLEASWGYIDQSKVVVYGALKGPQPVFPADGAVKVDWHPTFFKWVHSPSIGRGDVVSYKIEYTKDEALQEWVTVVIDRVTENFNANFDPMVKDNVIITLEPNTRYWWRVTDVDVNGGSTRSEVYSFTTKGKPGI
jgi:hypothetical protein